MTVSKTTTQEKARQWLIDGGGGHEDGEDGIRAGMWSVGSCIEHMAEFADSISAKLRQDNAAHAKNAKILVDENNRLEALTAELQKENAEIAKALGIHFCPELEEPWEVPMESEPDYFETLPKAAAFVYALLDKGLSDREKENARLREALEKLPLDSFGDDMGKHDAADFVDNAGYFFDAMLAARAALSKEKE